MTRSCDIFWIFFSWIIFFIYNFWFNIFSNYFVFSTIRLCNFISRSFSDVTILRIYSINCSSFNYVITLFFISNFIFCSYFNNSVSCWSNNRFTNMFFYCSCIFIYSICCCCNLATFLTRSSDIFWIFFSWIIFFINNFWFNIFSNYFVFSTIFRNSFFCWSFSYISISRIDYVSSCSFNYFITFFAINHFWFCTNFIDILSHWCRCFWSTRIWKISSRLINSVCCSYCT